MDFVRGKNIHSEPINSSLKHSSESISNLNKRSISPEIKRDNNNHVHNSEEHQNKRKKILIKRALLKSFISSVNTKINLKHKMTSFTSTLDWDEFKLNLSKLFLFKNKISFFRFILIFR